MQHSVVQKFNLHFSYAYLLFFLYNKILYVWNTVRYEIV